MHLRFTPFCHFAGPLMLAIMAITLTACTIGPLEISLRDHGSPPPTQDPAVASTVTAVFATNTAIAMLRTATADAAALAPAQVTPPPAAPATVPPLQGTTPQLRLEYSPESFALINTGNRAEDISSLRFQSAGGELASTLWDNGFLTTSLYAFPPGDCLMAWGLNAEMQEKPAACDVRHVWIAVSSQQAFWQVTGTFSVFWQGQLVAECAGSAGTCTITPP